MPHRAPFCFALVQGSRFRALVAALPPFLEDDILVSQPSPLGQCYEVKEIVSAVMTCFPLRGKCRRQYVQANWIFRSAATLKSSETPFRAQRDGAYQRSSNNAQYTVVLPPQPFGELPRWGAKNVLPLNLMALRCPAGAAVGFRSGMKKNVSYASSFRHPAMQGFRYPCLSLTIGSPVTPIKKGL